MIRCAACGRGVTHAFRAGKARAAAEHLESFPFRCPHCGALHQVSINVAGTLRLVLDETGALRTPSLLDLLWDDPEIRRALEEGDL
jgi:hypothetical protein